MTKKILSPEIISLIHYVELNESGWWKKAVGQVVKGALWKAEKPLSLTELHSALKQEAGIILSSDVLDKQLQALISQSSIMLVGELIKLTEHARQELTEAQRRAGFEQEECYTSFKASCATHCPALESEKVWEYFQQSLSNAIHIAGANFFHLLTDGNLQREVDWVSKFIARFDDAHREGIQRVMSDFFAHGNHACRAQVLRLLTAHFFAEATQLSPKTLAAIENKKSKRIIKVVLDTNFIFSVLQLHDNPGDDSVISLVDLAKRVAENLTIKLYVLPGTLDEAKRTISYQMKLVDKIRTTAAMSRAALRQPLPSIAKKFFDAASRSPGLSAAAFFQPYIDDLKTILKGKGIEVLDAHPSIYNQRQDVVDDVLDEIQREEREVPISKRKGYEIHLHDAVLWHAVKDRRPKTADSPFEVEYWAVSIDWRLIDFDRRKRKANATLLPVVLHPSNLVQLIQFWVPRSQQLEDSLVDTLRLPLFFQTFDPEDERATIQVLQALSRYENVGDLGEETLCSVLTNRALRGRIKEVDASNDDVFALVREELLTEHQAAINLLESTKVNLTTTTASLEDERRIREASENALVTTEKKLKDTQEAADVSHASLVRLRYIVGAVLAPAVVGTVLGGSVSVYLRNHANAIEILPQWGAVGALGLTPIALACVASPYVTKRCSALQNWWLAHVINWIGKKALIAPITLAIGAVYQGSVWDWVKALTHWPH